MFLGIVLLVAAIVVCILIRRNCPPQKAPRLWLESDINPFAKAANAETRS